MLQLSKERILTLLVNPVTLEDARITIRDWTSQRKGRYICVSNVHMCMETFDDAGYALVVNSSDLTVADGKPIFLALRMLGHRKSEHIRGVDLTLGVCRDAEKFGFSVGFFGSTVEVVRRMTGKLREQLPNCEIAYVSSPPFREGTGEEDQQVIESINRSGVGVLFVGLGCPKQEIWMAEHKGQLRCVLIGVGAAFDFLGGTKKSAPKWAQTAGLEWLFRLFDEPKRLWKRYLKHNPRFVALLTGQLLRNAIRRAPKTTR